MRHPGSGKAPVNTLATGNAADKPPRGGPPSGIEAKGGGQRPSSAQLRAGLIVDVEGRKDFAAEAFAILVEEMRTAPSSGERRSAAESVLNRAEGAPKEHLETENIHRVVSDRPMTAEEWVTAHGVPPANDTPPAGRKAG